jgi:hypothetical protein
MVEVLLAHPADTRRAAGDTEESGGPQFDGVQLGIRPAPNAAPLDRVITVPVPATR